jgi:hypothetical protein
MLFILIMLFCKKSLLHNTWVLNDHVSKLKKIYNFVYSANDIINLEQHINVFLKMYNIIINSFHNYHNLIFLLQVFTLDKCKKAFFEELF